MAYAIIAYLQSFAGAAPGEAVQLSNLVPFSLIVVGAILAFLWFNAHPAQLFMGDTGALALGATFTVSRVDDGAVVAAAHHRVGAPIAETVSVSAQVMYFKYTKRRFGEGRRLFKMAPLHHHFELLGWSETQIVQRFWLIGIWSAMIGIALALL